MSNKTSNGIIALLAGAAIGVGLGILFAPDKGSKTREKIKEGLDDLKDQTKTKWNDLEEETKEKFSKTIKVTTFSITRRFFLSSL